MFCVESVAKTYVVNANETCMPRDVSKFSMEKKDWIKNNGVGCYVIW